MDFNQLVDQEGDYLFRYALRLLSAEDQAEEAVQETFLAAYESAGRFEHKASVRTWLTSILRNKCIDKIRSKIRNSEVQVDFTGEEAASALFDKVDHWTEAAMPTMWNPEKSLGSKQFLGIVNSCLSKLPIRLRQVFILREIEEIDSRQVCNELELSASNLRVLLHRGRLLLRDCVEKHLGQD